MPFNVCDHVDKVLAFLLIGGKIEQVTTAVMKARERESVCLVCVHVCLWREGAK